ncbi:MAG TPA: GntR family transcriptional regulator [Thermodesulfobacteriota bacterium]|nr:GntR family transcriptional regulator [Thermodesulfobacteriota bacterium]
MINAVRKHRPNLSEIAYEEIKEMILSGELAQGERIVLERMSEQLNLSITPIREALNKLAQDDLILVTPRSSYEVISLDTEDINDILDLREMLETFALRTAGDNLTNFPVDSFRELLHKINSSGSYKKFVEADIKFHEAIIAASNNKRVGKLYSYIRNPERILMIPSAKIEGRIETAVKEHLAILKAIENKDLNLAVEHLSSHIQRVKSLLLQAHHEK